MEAQNKCKLSQLQPEVPKFGEEALLDVVKEVELRVRYLRPIDIDLETLVSIGHEVDNFLDALEIFGKVNLDFGVGGAVVLVAIEEGNQLGDELPLLLLHNLHYTDVSLTSGHLVEGIYCEVGVEVDAEGPEFFGKVVVVFEGLGDGGGSEAHDNGKPVFVLESVGLLKLLALFLLLEVELFHYSGVGMVAATVMALVEHHEGVVSDLDVPSPQAVEEHLRNHDSNSGLLHFLQEGFSVGHVSFDALPLGHRLVLALLSMDANDLTVEVLGLPVELYVLVTQSLPEILGEGVVVHDAFEGELDGLGLLLDQLDSVGQEDDLLAGSELAEVIVHGADGDPGLARTSRQADNAVSVARVLDEGGLEAPQVHLHSLRWPTLHLLFLLLYLLFVLKLLILLLDVHRHVLIFIQHYFLNGLFLIRLGELLISKLEVRANTVLIFLFELGLGDISLLFLLV